VAGNEIIVGPWIEALLRQYRAEPEIAARPKRLGLLVTVVVAAGAALAPLLLRFDHAAYPSDPEEHMIIIPPEGPTLNIEAGGKSIEAKADSLTIVPPGASKITAVSKGLFARVFSKASQDVIALASNAATYADGAPELAPPGLPIRRVVIPAPTEPGR